MKKTRETLLRKLAGLFSRDERVHSVFVTGSMNGIAKVTPLSDIDLWIILHEESGINSIKKELPQLFPGAAPVRMMYPCTDYHYFVIFENGVQLDFNMATAACYYSLNNPKKKILADRKRAHAKKHPATVSRHLDFVAEQLLIGYTTLERAASKYLKGDYVVTVRFLEGIRSNTVFTLLPFVEHVSIPNAVTVPLEKLSLPIRRLVIDSYAQPTRESCLAALTATLSLLDHIAEKTKTHTARDIHGRLETIFKTL